jgi:hypothetical protein
MVGSSFHILCYKTDAAIVSSAAFACGSKVLQLICFWLFGFAQEGETKQPEQKEEKYH